MKVIHTFEPVYDEEARVLILGSIPSVKSRENGFYYGHPSNRFWKVLECVFGESIGNSIDDKIEFLKKHHIALFDVIKSCDIRASQDNSIKNPIVNDFTSILEGASIKAIFTTGKKAYQLYQKYCFPNTGIEAIYLPSTSCANCKMGIENMVAKYSRIKDYTE